MGHKATIGTLPEDVWPYLDSRPPRTAGVLNQVASLLQQLGFHQTVSTLKKEAAKSGTNIDLVKWEKGTDEDKNFSLPELWHFWLEKKGAYPSSLQDSDLVEESSEDDEDEEMIDDEADETSGDESSDSEGDESLDSDSDSDSDESSSDDEAESSESSSDDDNVPAKIGQKRKRSAASSSEDDSTSDPESDSSSGSESSSSSDSDSDSDSDSSSSDVPPAKRVKVGSSDSDDEDGSSESDSDAPSYKEAVNKPLPSSSDSDSDGTSDSSSSDSESESGSDSSSNSDSDTGSDSDSGPSSSSSKTLQGDDQRVQPAGDDPSTSEETSDNGGMHPARMAQLGSGAAGPQAKGKENTRPVGKKQVVPFSRIPADQKVEPRFSSNAYVPYDYAQRAHQDLIVTKGKGFTKEKNKKKRGSYRGGTIDMVPKGIKFDD